MLLGLRRDADAAKLADEILEHYPRASGVHFQIAAMFGIMSLPRQAI